MQCMFGVVITCQPDLTHSIRYIVFMQFICERATCVGWISLRHVMYAYIFVCTLVHGQVQEGAHVMSGNYYGRADSVLSVRRNHSHSPGARSTVTQICLCKTDFMPCCRACAHVEQGCQSDILCIQACKQHRESLHSVEIPKASIDRSSRIPRHTGT